MSNLCVSDCCTCKNVFNVSSSSSPDVTVSTDEPDTRHYPSTVLKKGKEHIPLITLSFNARGLYSKFALLTSLIEEHDPDIVAITETWLDNSVLDQVFTPDGYKAFRKDRDISFYTENTYSMSNRGGVLFLIKSELNPTEYTKSDVKAEILWVQINPHPNVEYLYGVCYRPEVEEEVMTSRIIDSINLTDNENITLVGDFNFRNINWDDGTFSRPVEGTFVDTVNDHFLSQVVSEPTRGNNILDLVFVTDPSQVISCKVLPSLGNSDHCVVKFESKLLIPRVNSEPRKVYLYSKGDYEGLNNHVKGTEWETLLDSDDIDQNWINFKIEYDKAIETFIPHKFVKAGQRLKLPWSRYKSVKKARAKHRSTQIRARETGLFSDKCLADEAKEHLDSTILQAKGHYENKIVEQSFENPKRFWNYARHYSRSSSTIDVLEVDGVKYTKDDEMAEKLNDFFSSVTVDEPPCILRMLMELTNLSTYSEILISQLNR